MSIDDGNITLKLRGIKVILLDVDGVLTDGRIILGSEGFEFKSFDVRDGHRIKMARRGGLKVILITGRQSESVIRRGDELGVDGIFQSILDKAGALKEICELSGASPEEMVFMGDDLVDLPLMRLVRVSACPEDAAPDVIKRADLVIDSPGGRGAAGKLIEKVLDAQGKWQKLMCKYLNNND